MATKQPYSQSNEKEKHPPTVAICNPLVFLRKNATPRLSSITCGQGAKNRPNAIRIKKPPTLVIRICNAYRHQSD